jgi:NAD(P)H-flavin reductase
MKIALIVPSTTKGLDIDDITDTHLYKILIESLSKDKPKKHKITIYVGYDNDDKIYSNSEQRLKINALCEKVNIEWIEQNVEKGHVTEIWNNLGHRAVQDNFEYMYVCGDDIEIDNNKWMNDWIPKLKENNNIGWVAGYSHNDRIATQFLIHKTHIDIFGFVYPKEIKNYMK